MVMLTHSLVTQRSMQAITGFPGRPVHHASGHSGMRKAAQATGHAQTGSIGIGQPERHTGAGASARASNRQTRTGRASSPEQILNSAAGRPAPFFHLREVERIDVVWARRTYSLAKPPVRL